MSKGMRNNAFEAEISIHPFDSKEDLLEGVNLLRSLLETIVFNTVDAHSV